MPPSSDQDERPIGPDRAPPETTESGAETLHVVLDIDRASPSIARDRIRSWLRGHRWSPAHVDDLVLAVNEAVSNSIEHGYDPRTADPYERPVVEVDGRVVTEPNGMRHVELTVRDRGCWLDPALEKGTRGHGVRIMRACAEEVVIDHGDAGTTVVLRSRSIPPPLRAD